jgi:hypothetical protein
MEGIVDVGQAGIGARGGLVDLSRTHHLQSFVRALAIENFHEVIEAGLLLQEVGGRRFRGFFLQGEMHAFMASILLGMAGLDAFDADAQAQPPDGELTQVEQSMRRGEGHAIIAANVGRQAALLKQPFKRGKRVLFAGGGQSFAAQQETAGMIGDRERITVLAVAQQKLAL